MDTDSLPTAETKPTKLHWYQFRLRSLFILMTLVAIACSWIAVMRNQWRQKAAEKAIKQAGGYVTLEVGAQAANLSRTSITDDELVCLQGLDHLQRLVLSDTKVTDAGLAHLEGLEQLQRLDLTGTKVTDAGLVHLETLKQLQ
jgi:hypothetical protein